MSIGENIVMAQHHSFRPARSAGGIYDCCQLMRIAIDMSIAPVSPAAAQLSFPEASHATPARDHHPPCRALPES